MAGFKISGLDDLQRDLRRMQQNARRLEGKHEVSFDKLFTRSFMLTHTNYSSLDDLLEAGGFRAATNEEFEAIPEEKLDAHIAKCTNFNSWEDMLGEATEQYITDQLGF